MTTAELQTKLSNLSSTLDELDEQFLKQATRVLNCLEVTELHNAFLVKYGTFGRFLMLMLPIAEDATSSTLYFIDEEMTIEIPLDYSYRISEKGGDEDSIFADIRIENNYNATQFVVDYGRLFEATCALRNFVAIFKSNVVSNEIVITGVTPEQVAGLTLQEKLDLFLSNGLLTGTERTNLVPCQIIPED